MNTNSLLMVSFLLLLTLKIAGFITVSWWIIFVPLLIDIVLLILGIFIFLSIALITVLRNL